MFKREAESNWAYCQVLNHMDLYLKIFGMVKLLPYHVHDTRFAAAPFSLDGNCQWGFTTFY